MDSQTQQTSTLPTNVTDNAWFYAMRPDWLETDKEREAFKAQFPSLVERNADCWQSDQTPQQA